MAESSKIIAVAWYRRYQWNQLLSCSVDTDELESTYQEWLDQAAKKIAKIKAAGINIVRVDVDVEKLIKWCEDMGRPVDGESRSLYAAIAAKDERNILWKPEADIHRRKTNAREL